MWQEPRPRFGAPKHRDAHHYRDPHSEVHTSGCPISAVGRRRRSIDSVTRSIAAAMHAPTPLAGVNGTVCCEGDGLWPCGVRASGLSPRRGRRLTPQNPAAQHPDPSGPPMATAPARRRPGARPDRRQAHARRRGRRRWCARTAAWPRQGGEGAGAGAPGPPPGPGKAARAPAPVRPDRRQAQARRRGLAPHAALQLQ